MSNVIPLTRPKHLIPDHELRELVNDLRDIAVKYHDHGCLRELISSRVTEALKRDHSTGLENGIGERSHSADLISTPLHEIEQKWQKHFGLNLEESNGETDISPA